jgi:integrase
MRATVLAYSTGCRSYEIKSLQLEDLWLDRECPSIRIQREKTKSNAGSREVALNAFALWAIRELLLRARMLGAAEPDHYLFPANFSKHTKAGDPMKERTGYDPSHHQNSWSSAWESLKKAAGLSRFRFHDLRHTFITQGIEAGVPVQVMKSQVGNMSAEMVEHYTHLSVNAKMKAAEKVQEQNPGIADVLGIGTVK